MVASVFLTSPWGHGEVFAAGLTPVSAPIFALIASLPLAYLVYRTRLNLRLFDFLPLILVMVVLASYWWTLYSSVWSWTTYWYGACFGLYIAARVYAPRARQIYALITAGAAGALITVPFLHPTSGGDVALVTVNQNFTAYAYATAVYLLMIIQLTRARALWKILAVAISIVLAFGIVYMGTRGALLSVILMSAWLFYANATQSLLARPLFFIGMGVALLFSFGVLEWIPHWVESAFGNSSGDLSGRSSTWAVARLLIWHSPFIGIGAGAFRYVSPDEIGAHNIFLALALDAGLVGMFAFIVFIVGGLRPALKSSANPSQLAMLGLFGAFFLPIASTGHIERAPYFWVALALTFTILRLPSDRPPAVDERRA